MCPSLITPYYVYVSMSIYIYICITWLVEPPLKNLLAKLDHPVLKFPSLISVAMHIISPQQPPLQSSSSQAFCKRMCLIVRLRIRNHLKGKKNSRKMNCCKEAENVQGKGTWNYSGKQTSTDYQTQFGQVPCCYLSKGLLTLDLDLYFTWCFIMLNAFVLQPHLLHVSSVGEDVGQVSHAPAIMSRLAQRHEYSLWSLVSLY